MSNFLSRIWDRLTGAELRAMRAELAEMKASGPGRAPVSPAQGTERKLNSAKQAEREGFKGWSYVAIRAIAQRVAGQPFRVATQGGKPLSSKALSLVPGAVKGTLPEGFGIVAEHPILSVLDNPNPFLTSWALRYITVAQLELTGAAHWWTFQESGQWQIWPIPTSWIRPDHDSGNLFNRYLIRSPGSGQDTVVNGDEITRFVYPDPSAPLVGFRSPLLAISTAVNVDDVLQNAQLASYLNGANPELALIVGDWPGLEDPNMKGGRITLSADQRHELMSVFTAHYSGHRKRGLPLILDGFITDAKQISSKPSEMDFLDSSEVSRERVTQGLGANDVVLGRVQNANRAGATVAEKVFVNNTINPKIEALSACLQKSFAPRFDADARMWIERAKAEDPEQDREDMALLAKHRSITVNELRAWHGLEPIDGGDELVSAGTSQDRREEGQRSVDAPFRLYFDDEPQPFSLNGSSR